MSPGQYAVLSAVRDGRPHTMWPTMRNAFRARGWISAIGPRIAPSDERRSRVPTRPYVVTRAGLEALREYELGPERSLPVPYGALKIGFGKESP